MGLVANQIFARFVTQSKIKLGLRIQVYTIARKVVIKRFNESSNVFYGLRGDVALN
jgi:hypothetical protein